MLMSMLTCNKKSTLNAPFWCCCADLYGLFGQMQDEAFSRASEEKLAMLTVAFQGLSQAAEDALGEFNMITYADWQCTCTLHNAPEACALCVSPMSPTTN